ncbi:MAG: YceD family protein [Halioglobus sp.]
MLADRLPTTLDVRKAAVRGSGVSGFLKPLDLPRVRPLLASDDGTISVEMAFSRDEERHYLMSVAIEAAVAVTCQRCLEPMTEHFGSNSTLAVVWTDQEAAHLPKHLDPLILGDLPCDLWQVVEDELILALPAFSYHSSDACKVNIDDFSDPVSLRGTGEEKPKPLTCWENSSPAKSTKSTRSQSNGCSEK